MPSVRQDTAVPVLFCHCLQKQEIYNGNPSNLLGFFNVNQNNQSITQLLSDKMGNPPVTIDKSITDVMLADTFSSDKCFCTVSELYGSGDKIFK